MLKFTHRLFLIVAASFLLLACSVVNLNAQEKPPGERARRSRPAPTPVATEAGSGTIETLREVITTQLSQPENTIRVEVRYPTAYGYKYATGLFVGDPGPNSCGEFSVAAAPARPQRRTPVTA